MAVEIDIVYSQLDEVIGPIIKPYTKDKKGEAEKDDEKLDGQEDSSQIFPQGWRAADWFPWWLGRILW